MSLITRCPACGTSFRVVPDQLRISQGWVRCGQCAEVFDAEQALHNAAAPQAPAVFNAPRPSSPDMSAGEAAGFADTVASGDQTHGDQLGSGAGDALPVPTPPADTIDSSTPTLVDMAPAWAQAASSEMPVTDSVASLDMGLAEYQQTQVQPDSAPAPLSADAPDRPEPELGSVADDLGSPAGDMPVSPTAAAPTATPTDATSPDAGARAAAPLDDALPPADLGPGRLHVAPADPGARLRQAAAPSSGGMPLLRRAAADAPEPAPAPSMVTARPPAPPPP